jgi:hypothetical protein
MLTICSFGIWGVLFMDFGERERDLMLITDCFSKVKLDFIPVKEIL